MLQRVEESCFILSVFIKLTLCHGAALLLHHVLHNDWREVHLRREGSDLAPRELVGVSRLTRMNMGEGGVLGLRTKVFKH